MKFGIRTPSLKRRFAARTSLKRMVRAKVRVPRGMGIITNPKRALYNKVYNRTSVSVDRLARSGSRSSRNANTALGFKAIGYFLLFCISIAFWPIGLIVVGYLVYKYFFKRKKMETELSQVSEPQNGSN